MIEILAWVAVAILSVSYWFQIYKIHVHKEVRDLSITFHWLLFCGFLMLAIQAFMQGAILFMVKNTLTTIPVGILIFQIYYHSKDTWYDDAYADCISCDTKIEPSWLCCPKCGSRDFGLPH